MSEMWVTCTECRRRAPAKNGDVAELAIADAAICHRETCSYYREAAVGEWRYCGPDFEAPTTTAMSETVQAGEHFVPIPNHDPEAAERHKSRQIRFEEAARVNETMAAGEGHTMADHEARYVDTFLAAEVRCACRESATKPHAEDCPIDAELHAAGLHDHEARAARRRERAVPAIKTAVAVAAAEAAAAKLNE